jgi:hypothetical protein
MAAPRLLAERLITTKIQQVVKTYAVQDGAGNDVLYTDPLTGESRYYEDMQKAVATAEANITVGGPGGDIVEEKMDNSVVSQSPRISQSVIDAHSGGFGASDVGRLSKAAESN